MQSAILPPVVQEKFAKFFDETPQAPFEAVEKVLMEEYGGGRGVADRVFAPGSFQKRAVGSASVAQVHRARLVTGEEVAVKVQKPWIQRQVGVDLFIYRIVTNVFSDRLFGLPLGFLTAYISERLYSETDFKSEAHNAMQTAAFIESEPSLRGKIHVPKVYEELSTKRILVAEWIDGVGVAEREIVTGQWRDSASVGHPMNTPRTVAQKYGPILRIRGDGSGSADKRMSRRIYGLGLREKDIMQTMVDVFCAQMFLFGWVPPSLHPSPPPPHH